MYNLRFWPHARGLLKELYKWSITPNILIAISGYIFLGDILNIQEVPNVKNSEKQIQNGVNVSF